MSIVGFVQKYKMIIAITLIVIAIIISSLFYALRNRKPIQPKIVSITPFIKQEESNSSKTNKNIPQLRSNKYEIKSQYPNIPESLNVYYLKTNYSQSEIAEFASKFGLTEISVSKEDPRYYVLTELNNPEKRGYMLFDSLTGAFTYKSWGNLNISLEKDSSFPYSTALSFISAIGMNDGTILCTDKYELKETQQTNVTVQ